MILLQKVIGFLRFVCSQCGLFVNCWQSLIVSLELLAVRWVGLGWVGLGWDGMVWVGLG